MNIRIKRGRKNEFGRDYIILVNGRAISFREVFKVLQLMFENEDRIYPVKRGFRGRAMLVEAIYDLAQGMSIDDIYKRYKVVKGHGTLG